MPEVLSALLDDNLAMKEKIGSANYVWSFPSDAYKKAKTKHETHTTQVDELKNQVMAKETKKKELEVGREETEEYVQMLAEMKSQKKQVQALQAEEAANASNDPAVLKELAVLVNEIKQHINRVTDNTFELLSFCVKKGMDRQDVKGFLNITDSFDNVDWKQLLCAQYYLFVITRWERVWVWTPKNCKLSENIVRVLLYHTTALTRVYMYFKLKKERYYYFKI